MNAVARARRAPVRVAMLALIAVPDIGTPLAQPSVDGPLPVVGDAIAASLTGRPGDPARGRAIVADRTRGLCLLCHPAPIAEERFQGNLAPDLAGIGARLSPAQLRLRVADARRLNPDSIMPSFFRTDGLTRVAAAFRDRPVLSAEEIEDVVAWLATLSD